jgi:hypothetical protein
VKLIHYVFICLIVMAISGGYAMYAPETTPNILGHPDGIAEMTVGGNGVERFIPIQWAVFVFQCASLAVGPFLMALGVREERRTTLFKLLMAGSTVCVLASWAALFFSYKQFLDTGETGYFFGFPVPTAWMIYGTWISALSFISVFGLGFRVFVLPKEDEDAFTAYAAELRAKEQGGA